MEIKYPIKYTAMPIKERDYRSRPWETVCYIVSPCYLMADITKYQSDGHSIKEYEVVFPYRLNPSNPKWERNNPSIGCNRICTNSNKVDAIFDSYEEALNYATSKNEEIRKHIWSLPPSYDVEEKERELDAKISKYKELEQYIILYTTGTESDIGNDEFHYIMQYSETFEPSDKIKRLYKTNRSK